MLKISNNVRIPEDEIAIQAVRAQGPGGQKVNKAATAIHLRFDIRNSSLPEFYKERLLKLPDQRITRDGLIVIKSQRARSQEKNRADALRRLQALIRTAGETTKPRRPTKPSQAAKRRRLEAKKKQQEKKSRRKKVF